MHHPHSPEYTLAPPPTHTHTGGSSEEVTKFAGRFQAVAARNAASMQRALDAAYTAAVKQWQERE